MKTDKEFGLIIGRFQPPCLHHLQFINQVINSGIKKLLLGIGDAGVIDDRNFLTAAQVESLLIPNLDLLNFPYEIKLISDIHNPPKYADHVKKFFTQINDSNTCLFTENEYLYNCFINYGHNFQLIKPKILPTRATNIRQMITDNNLEWRNLVPINVSDFITNNKPKFW